MQARAPSPVASLQQSHLAKLRHTEPGVHETRDAPQIGPFQATISYELEAVASATRLVNNVELDPSHAMLRLAAPLATPRIKAAVAQNLGELRLVLEGGRPA